MLWNISVVFMTDENGIMFGNTLNLCAWEDHEMIVMLHSLRLQKEKCQIVLNFIVL
jgi:hypothetical protein